MLLKKTAKEDRRVSKKTNSLALEVQQLILNYGAESWHVVEAMLQIIDREKIIALNKYRKAHGEQPIIPEPTRYKETNNKNVGWFIDVPKEWYSITGKDKNA